MIADLEQQRDKLLKEDNEGDASIADDIFEGLSSLLRIILKCL